MRFTFDVETRLVELPEHQVFAFKRAMELLNSKGDEMEHITPETPNGGTWQEKMRLTSLLIGQETFEELLMELDDEFFGRDEAGKLAGWSDILHAAIQGKRDARQLAEQVLIYS